MNKNWVSNPIKEKGLSASEYDTDQDEGEACHLNRAVALGAARGGNRD